jgi:hypothetical protein
LLYILNSGRNEGGLIASSASNDALSAAVTKRTWSTAAVVARISVFCVLCFVFCVLCFVFCVLCFVFCILCFVFDIWCLCVWCV